MIYLHGICELLCANLKKVSPISFSPFNPIRKLNPISSSSIKKKNKVIGLSGFNGGFLKKNSNVSIYVPINNYGIVEDCHHLFMHILVQFIRQKNIIGSISKKKF